MDAVPTGTASGIGPLFPSAGRQAADFLAALGARGCSVKSLPGGRWRAQCPRRRDRGPSLSVTWKADRLLDQVLRGLQLPRNLAGAGLSNRTSSLLNLTRGPCREGE